MNISYDYYRIFYYVAKYKSFTAASVALMNNQPNITRMIKKLEYQLGCTLFVRQRHGVALTAEGEKLYARVCVAFENILLGEEEIAKDKSLQSGIVTVAASEIALRCVLLPALKKFRKAYPGIKIRILNQSTPQAINSLKKGISDLAVVTQPFDLPDSLRASVLRAICEVPVCSADFSLSTGCALSDSQIKKYPIIGLGDQTGSFDFYTEVFAKRGLAYTPDIEAATADQILPMIKSDLGIGFVPIDFLENENMTGLVILDMKPPIPERNICVLKNKQIQLSLAAAELEREIKNGYEKYKK